MSTAGRILAAAVTVMVWGSVALLGGLACSGDTDDCDPGWANDVLPVFGAAAGVYLLVRICVGVRARWVWAEFAGLLAVVGVINAVGTTAS